MVERRHIRVLVPYSRTLYFNDKGRERGIAADYVRDFEQYINKKYAKQLGKRPITVYMAPTTRDELLKDIADGLSDIAAGNLTVTDERRKIVDFVALADQKPVSELVVTGPASPAIATAEPAGKTSTRAASSHYEPRHAQRIRMKESSLKITSSDAEIIDMMEMECGLFEAIVVDDWKLGQSAGAACWSGEHGCRALGRAVG
jgi:membrane-bound lytic murein transglycosylase MltF